MFNLGIAYGAQVGLKLRLKQQLIMTVYFKNSINDRDRIMIGYFQQHVILLVPGSVTDLSTIL